MQRLLIGDVVSVAKFLPDIAARAHIGRIFGELKDVGAEKTDAILNRVLQSADRGHD